VISYMISKFKKFILLILLIAITLPVLAQQKDIEITLDNTEISLGASIRMDMVFDDAEDMPEPTMPEIKGLKISYLRSTDMISRLDGKIRRGRRHTYLIMPETTGVFTIGPFDFVYNGTEYVSKKIGIRITSGLSRPTELKPETASEEEFRAKENAFFIMVSDKDRVYVNEPFQIAAALYYKDIQVTDIEYPALDHEGLSIDEFKSPQASRKQIKGYDYRIITFKNTAFAIRPGDLKLGPAKISCSMYAADASRSTGLAAGSSQKKASLRLESTPRNITVLPLPQGGKPESFKGAVGNFQLSLDVKPEGYIKTGEAITLIMGVSGNGNFNMVSAPVIKENQAFIFYNPSIESETDSYKSFKQIIMPKENFIKEIPEIEFSFFDPIKEKYIILKKGPIAIQVFETEARQASTIIEARDKTIPEKIEQEPIGEGIIYIKETAGKLKGKGLRLYKDKTYLLLHLMPVFLYISIALLYKRHKRFKEDIRYARAKKAQRQARIGLKHAYSILSSGGVEKFYSYIFECIQEYFGNKFNLPHAGITSDVTERVLKSRNADPSVILQVKKFFDNCYLVRFTPYGYEKKDMLDTLEMAKMIIEYCRKI